MNLEIRLADGRVQEERAALYRPQILSNSVSVLLDEDVEAVPEFQRNEFSHWRPARRQESARNPIIRVQLSQEPDGSMAAAIGNAGREAIKVDLYLRAPGSSLFEYTSTCPIPPGSTVYEYWNQAVVEVQVRSARLVSNDAALMCD